MIEHRLFLIRHGQTEDNLAERLTGQGDSSLTALGLEQAQANGRTLAQLIDLTACDFVASPLGRAIQTMEIVRRAADIHPTGYRTDDRLMECNFGAWHGKPWRDSKTYWKALRARQGNDAWHTAWPGGESRAEFFERVRGFLETLTRDTVVVSHGGTVRMIRGALLKLSNDDILAFAPPNAGIIEISRGRERMHGQ
ncbi:MAG: histidine phosphatase family protein [Alphaproteobacteria bacterium]|nr:histidine phosphatase family protein [Alphaproteobacteria bacterium]